MEQQKKKKKKKKEYKRKNISFDFKNSSIYYLKIIIYKVDILK